MKAYVIKNKEGEYWCGNDIFSATIDIRKIYICEDFDYISKVINNLSSEGLLTDCEVVEITIVEGDLEKQIRADERRKVCQEIRNIFLKSLELPDEEWVWNSDCYAGMSLIKEILDKIEKGESE